MDGTHHAQPTRAHGNYLIRQLYRAKSDGN
jgi:hypothetical protein